MWWVEADTHDSAAVACEGCSGRATALVPADCVPALGVEVVEWPTAASRASRHPPCSCAFHVFNTLALYCYHLYTFSVLSCLKNKNKSYDRGVQLVTGGHIFKLYIYRHCKNHTIFRRLGIPLIVIVSRERVQNYICNFLPEKFGGPWLIISPNYLVCLCVTVCIHPFSTFEPMTTFHKILYEYYKKYQHNTLLKRIY